MGFWPRDFDANELDRAGTICSNIELDDISNRPQQPMRANVTDIAN